MMPPESVVAVIRRDVPRPSEYGEYFPQTGFRFETARGPCCPMGLHPKSTFACPMKAEEFAGGVCSQKDVMSFARWWDNVLPSELDAATNLIWGPVK